MWGQVNGRLVPLDYKFKNGDVAEIVTNAAAKPSRDWLNVAQSSHASGEDPPLPAPTDQG